MAYIQGEDRQQITLFPDAIDDYISEENSVRVIDAYVNSLNMMELGFLRTELREIGRPAYNPQDLLKLYIYGYMNRIRSSRRLETEAGRNLELIWLLRKLKPDFKTIADFRKDNKAAIKNVFKNFSLLCKNWDLYSKKVVAVDGSKFRASNSKRNNFNEKKIQRQLKYIDEKINTYLQELESNDKSEADIHIPSSEEIKQRINELNQRKAKYTAMQERMAITGETEISTTDPDARLMKANNNGIDVSYNVQTVVDQKYKLVVDTEVTNNPADQGQLNKMAGKAKQIFEAEEIKAVADKGYYSTNDLIECADNHIETYVAKPKPSVNTPDPDFSREQFKYNKEQNYYVCPTGQILYASKVRKVNNVEYQDYKNFRACCNCEMKDHCTKSQKGRTISRNQSQEFLDTVDKRTMENKELYAQRQMLVEHPFGTVKRIWGYSYFLTRGIKSVAAENSLHFLAYNLRRVISILGVKEMIRKLAMA
ncbi:MAG TPA: IS1182 family transposase [Syntrophomonadaceae bacterium]|nr:IS1182 family transposase [Syntrophomonadaceae bacterium]